MTAIDQLKATPGARQVAAMAKALAKHEPDVCGTDGYDAIEVSGLSTGVGPAPMAITLRLGRDEFTEFVKQPAQRIIWRAVLHHTRTPRATWVGEESIRRILGALQFSGDEVYKKVNALSGGERARLLLAELIMQKVNLLLLDEPTNHLDLVSKEVVTQVFKEYKGTIILVSHDRYILNNVCTQIWSVGDGKMITSVGNYDDYRYHIAHK